jgi:hypothetical protein
VPKEDYVAPVQREGSASCAVQVGGAVLRFMVCVVWLWLAVCALWLSCVWACGDVIWRGVYWAALARRACPRRTTRHLCRGRAAHPAQCRWVGFFGMRRGVVALGCVRIVTA